ncbi:recombinase family protein [Paenibacillus ehimensis]|uniref:recombinase family protein n=1 Tax=Paenibacillus ehimensis TaxID=79264 RepID=UPI000FDA10C1|nr:recombinase family protein [Paenibacillus ehimensis]
MIAIYARVSTEEQAKHGYSLQDQIRQCRKKAGTADIREYIDDGYSGEFLARPGLERLRQDVRDGIIKKVIVFDADRWSRNLMNQLIITEEIEKKATIEFVNGEYAKTPEGRLFYQMRGAISEYEKAKINERTSRGRREKARQGRVLRDFRIYGYSFDRETEQLFINQAEAAIVKLIFDLFTQPNNLAEGINGIAKYLTESGVPTKRGGKVWHRQVVRQILMNRTYTGEFYQNKWDTEGMHGNKQRPPEDKIQMRLRPKEEWIRTECPRIISDYQFEHAQKLIADSKRRFAKASLNQYLLSGLMRCGICGNTMTGRKSRNWGKTVFEYTDKKNTSGAKNKGCGMRIRCDMLDEQVWERVSKFLSAGGADEFEEEQREQKMLEEVEYDRIKQEIDNVRLARKRLVKLFASEDIDESGQNEVREQLRELSDKENALNDKLANIQEILDRSKKIEFSRVTAQDAVKHYLEKKDALTFDDKKELIRMVVREVQVFKDRIDIYSF